MVPVNVTLFGIEIFIDVIKMKLYYSGVGSLEVETQTQREVGHVKRETEVGVMLLQAKEHLELPEGGRDKKGFSPKALPIP